MNNCMFCGEPERLGVFEMWSDHTFMLDTCCEGMHEMACIEMAADPDWAADIMRREDVEEIVGSPIRRVAFADNGVFIDYHLTMKPIQRHVAMRFVEKHHDHKEFLGRLAGDRFRTSIWNGLTMLGVCVVGNPCAPSYNGRGWLEVRRLCLDRSIPDALRWKACSALYRWAAQQAERRGYNKIITYTTKDETGMSLRYARWKCEGKASREGATWDCPSRPRPNSKPGPEKVRWSKKLQPTFVIPKQLDLWRNAA